MYSVVLVRIFYSDEAVDEVVDDMVQERPGKSDDIVRVRPRNMASRFISIPENKSCDRMSAAEGRRVASSERRLLMNAV